MKKIICIILIVLAVMGALGGGIFGIIKLTDSDKFDQKKLSHIGRYDIGGLDSQGNYMSTNASIYTKNPIECQGLNCTLSFDSTVTYQIYFYDQNNEFVHTTGVITGAFQEDSVPFFAKYARIVITPKDDDKVTTLEKNNYAKQLTVKVNSEQGFKNYTDNLFDFKYNGYYILTGEMVKDDGETAQHPGCVTSEFVNFSMYKEALYFKLPPNSDKAGVLQFYFYDSEKNYVDYSNVSNLSTSSFLSSTGVYYFKLDLSKIPANSCYLRCFSITQPYPEIFFK